MTHITRRIVALALTWSLAAAVALAQEVPEKAPPSQTPDPRLKADVLLVVAHPDDESAVSSYLARAVFDEGKRVAVVFITSGEGGRNAVGLERGASMGAVRQIEALRACGELGIDRVWFLDGRDTATQNVLLSLSSWGHGAVLEQTVRIVRLTQPDVIFAWLPRVVAGENHGDHQASGVVATEAFDAAGDPTAFPGQLAPPRLRFPPEDLEPWQPKKLYFFSDAFDKVFLDGKGPSYDPNAVSRTRKVPYWYLALKSSRHHLSQFATGFPQPLLDALAKDDLAAVTKIQAERNPRGPQPVRLVLGKSLVGGSATGDVFENVSAGPIAFTPAPGSRPEPASGITFGLDGPWRFYAPFWRVHGLDRLAGLDPMDLVSVRPASELRVPMVIRNDAASAAEVTLARTSPLPAGWVEQPMSRVYPLGPRDSYRVEAVLTTATEMTEPVALTYEARSGATVVGTVTLRVLVKSGTMPQ